MVTRAIKLSWREVFNGDKAVLPGDNIQKVLDIVGKTRYSFFSFNGTIYMVMDSPTGKYGSPLSSLQDIME